MPTKYKKRTFLKKPAMLVYLHPSLGSRVHRPRLLPSLLPAPPLIPCSSVSGGRPMCTTLGLALGEGGEAGLLWHANQV